MCDASASNCEFTEIVANHFWLNLDRDEGLSAVDGDGLSNKFWKDRHVASVRSDGAAVGTAHAAEEMFVLNGETTGH